MSVSAESFISAELPRLKKPPRKICSRVVWERCGRGIGVRKVWYLTNWFVWFCVSHKEKWREKSNACRLIRQMNLNSALNVDTSRSSLVQPSGAHLPFKVIFDFVVQIHSNVFPFVSDV